MNLSINTQGRDFFVGDIHGCIDQLNATMDKIKFDRAKDRMICVGDLIDRGPFSLQSLSLLTEPWFYCVLGNHEDMLIRAYEGDVSWYQTWMKNGGGWWNEVPEEARRRCYDLIRLRMPQKIVVETEFGRIGVIHADVYGHWDEWADQPDEYGLPAAIWGRRRWNRDDDTPVTGIDQVVVGHTVVDEVTRLGNITYIDTGACFSDGRMTVMQAKEFFE